MSSSSVVSFSMWQLRSFLLLLLLSVSSAMRDGHAAPEPDSTVHVRSDPGQLITKLGRHNFNVTVQQEYVDDWVVLFCVDWLEHCQGLWHDYLKMASHWEHTLKDKASSWQKTAVRFAEVDCATDKPLCNENFVQNYPSVHHFKGGKFYKTWDLSPGATSLSADISKWVSKELTPKLVRKEPKKQNSSLNVRRHVRDFFAMLSFNDPATATAAYSLMAVAVFIFVYVLGTGLEIELATVLSSYTKTMNKMKDPMASGLLPNLKEMGATRTIVRNSFEL